ncbi:MAG: hypothetical protein WKG07_38395 [Hymenobacter sp.]
MANPGCFATAIRLALLPLAQGRASCADGGPRVGHHGQRRARAQSLAEPRCISPWRTGNVSTYKPFTHQHLGEIGETSGAACSGQSGSRDSLHPVPRQLRAGHLRLGLYYV